MSLARLSANNLRTIYDARWSTTKVHGDGKSEC